MENVKKMNCLLNWDFQATEKQTALYSTCFENSVYRNGLHRCHHGDLTFWDLSSSVISVFSNSVTGLMWHGAFVHINTTIHGNPHCASVMRQKMADSIKRPYFCNLFDVQVTLNHDKFL